MCPDNLKTTSSSSCLSFQELIVQGVCVCVCVCVCVIVTQSCPTLCDPMDCSLPSSSPGILQARILKRVAVPFSRVSSRPRNLGLETWVSCIAGGFSTIYANMVQWKMFWTLGLEALVIICLFTNKLWGSATPFTHPGSLFISIKKKKKKKG